MGIDNINDYYDPALKQARLHNLKPYRNFSFEKIDIAEKAQLTKAFKTFKPEKVVHLAAQAGVRYSIENPYAYLDANLTGFLNILELCRHNEVEGLIYASSSSVYGANTKIPFSTDDQTDHPIALYGATKKANELMAHAYSHLYKLHTTGLRYFTVYGPWGRPDMALYLFSDAIIAGRPIHVFNNGDMLRDFTYIDDIVSGTLAALDRPPADDGTSAPHALYNLGNNHPEPLMRLIGLLEAALGQKAETIFEPLQPGDVAETYADIESARRDLGFAPAMPIEVGVPRFVEWYRSYNG